MTSPQARNAVLSSSLKKKHYLETDKDGIPLQRQVPITYEVYSGAGNETYTPIGANGLSVAGALAGPLTIDFRTNAPNYYFRQIYITIVGGVGQNVNIQLPLAPYNTIEFGTPNFINNYVVAPSANHQLIWIGFGDLGAGLVQLA